MQVRGRGISNQRQSSRDAVLLQALAGWGRNIVKAVPEYVNERMN